MKREKVHLAKPSRQIENNRFAASPGTLKKLFLGSNLRFSVISQSVFTAADRSRPRMITENKIRVEIDSVPNNSLSQKFLAEAMVANTLDYDQEMSITTKKFYKILSQRTAWFKLQAIGPFLK